MDKGFVRNEQDQGEPRGNVIQRVSEKPEDEDTGGCRRCVFPGFSQSVKAEHLLPPCEVTAGTAGRTAPR